jgi:hypothetical protein
MNFTDGGMPLVLLCLESGSCGLYPVFSAWSLCSRPFEPQTHRKNGIKENAAGYFE